MLHKVFAQLRFCVQHAQVLAARYVSLAKVVQGGMKYHNILYTATCVASIYV